MKIKKIIAVTSLVALLGMPLQVHAQLGGFKIPSVPGLGGSNSSSFDLNGGQASLFSSFSAAQGEMLQAQILLANAFELKELADTLKAEADYVASGAVDAGGMKGSFEKSASAQDAITERMDSGAELSEEGKQYFLASIPHLLQGTLALSKLPAEVQSVADGVKSVAQNGSVMQKVEAAKLVAPTASLASAMPGFVKSSYDNYKKVITYGQQKSLPVPVDATAALGNF